MSQPQTQTGDPVLPEARLNLVTPKAPQIGIVVSNDLCLRGKSASYVRHTVLDVSGTDLAGNFLVGQSFGVIPPGLDDRGKPHKVRLYSIACPSWGEDGAGKLVSTTPKRLIEEYKAQKKDDDSARHTLFHGVCSNYLCDLLPGAEVAVTGPA
jgi:ferredoxin--NADP+ reductase